MLVPPPRSIAGPEGTTSRKELGAEASFRTPEGVWEAVDCLHVPAPMPHPSDPAPVVVNPLAGHLHHPGTHTPGVRLTPFPVIGMGTAPRMRKPRNSLHRNKSSYMSRTVIFDRFNWMFGEKVSKPVITNTTVVTACTVSVGRCIAVFDADADSPHRESPLVRMLFAKAWPLTHSINLHTRAPGNVDLVLGMSSGDIIWTELANARYSRINKAGNITRAAVTAIAWVPGTESLVLAGHADGTLVLYDIEREDAPRQTLIPSDPRDPHSTRVLGSRSLPNKGPLVACKISNQPITDFAFLRSQGAGVQVAVTARDGYVRFVDMDTETVTDLIPSFFGGLFTIELSPDGRYFACGGEDDDVSIYCAQTRELQARLTGHAAWVRRVVWDSFAFSNFGGSIASEGLYRLMSVGEDGEMLFWDFNPRSLPRARAPAPRGECRHVGRAILHPFVPKDAVASILPIVRVTPTFQNVEILPLTDLYFTREHLSVSSSEGRIWTWTRPDARADATSPATQP